MNELLLNLFKTGITMETHNESPFETIRVIFRKGTYAKSVTIETEMLYHPTSVEKYLLCYLAEFVAELDAMYD